MSEEADAGQPGTGTGKQQPVDVLTARLHELLVASTRQVIVGIDGRSGVGKSTLAGTVAARFVAGDDGRAQVLVIDGDDFYSGGSAARWDALTAAEKADRVIDWRRQRAVLQRLRRDGVAQWHPFDWDAKDWDSETAPLAPEPTLARAPAITILEGAYSCRPELHDQLDLKVLVTAPADVRRQRLRHREGEDYQADWESRWTAAEVHYFGAVMPSEQFDLVIDGTAGTR